MNNNIYENIVLNCGKLLINAGYKDLDIENKEENHSININNKYQFIVDPIDGTNKISRDFKIECIK